MGRLERRVVLSLTCACPADPLPQRLAVLVVVVVVVVLLSPWLVASLSARQGRRGRTAVEEDSKTVSKSPRHTIPV